MRLPLGAVLLVLSFAAAIAQQQPALPALPRVQTPNTPPVAPPLVAPRNQPAPAQPPAPEAAPSNTWLPRPVADLLALDKITARTTTLTVRAGQSATFGTLTIAVRACDVRPADQPADATAFLDITDSHAGAPQFHGWMLLSAPAVSMLQHPIYDVRLAGCHE